VSAHATLLVGWSGTLAFLAIWFGLLARLRPDDGALSRFAVFALANACGLVATAAVRIAPVAAEGALARSLQIACFATAAGLAPGLATHVTGRTPPGAGVARALAALLAVIAASGALVDPAAPRPVGPAGVALAVSVGLALVPSLSRLVRAARRVPALRVVAAASLLALFGATADLASLGSGSSPLELTALAAGVLTLAIGATLMRRVVEGEEELERSSVLLASSLRDLRAAETALVEAQSRAALGELAAVIAHEVRNPLAVLRNAASALRKPTTSSVDVETLVDIVQEETRRLETLGRSLSHFAEPMPYRPERVVLRPLLEDVVTAVRRAHDGARAIRVEIVCGDEEAVQADPGLLRQALVNVVDNAVRAMAAGGVVEIAVTREPARCVLQVRDDGEGMSPTVLARARDPFFTTRATGTGLGLALVDKVVRLHGGELVIASREPRGCEISLVLPLEAPAPDASA
jgi:signal transduction histidine kinase